MKKLLRIKLKPAVVAVLAMAALALLLVPLVRILRYTTPWYDDYNYGSFVKAFLSEERTLGSALQGAWYCVRTQWYAWAGYFASIWFNTLVPMVWGEEYYFLGPAFVLCLLLAALFVLVGVLARRLLQADWASCVVLQAGTAILAVEFMHTVQTGLYWYNAAVHYVGMHSFLMLTIAAAVGLLTGKGKKSLIILVPLTMLGALLGGGSNFVTCLQGLLIFCLLLVLELIARKKRGLLMLPATAVYIYAFYLNVSAPGNNVRAASYVGWGYSAPVAILRSFLEGVRYLGTFTGVRTWLVLLLLVPVIWHVVRHTSFRFRLPLLVLAVSFGLYCSGFTPSLYSLGHAGLGRTLNAVKLTFQLLLVLNEVYLLGWLVQRVEQAQNAEDPQRAVFVRKIMRLLAKCGGDAAPWWYYAAVCAALAVTFAVSPSQATDYSSYMTYYFVHTGEAYNYYQEYLERVEILKSDETDIVFEPYHYTPYPICCGDLSDDPKQEENRAVSDWYGKNSVRITGSDE